MWYSLLQDTQSFECLSTRRAIKYVLVLTSTVYLSSQAVRRLVRVNLALGRNQPKVLLQKNICSPLLSRQVGAFQGGLHYISGSAGHRFFM